MWVVAAAAATAVGLAAVAAIGTDIFGGGQDPLSQSEVDDLLASRNTPPPTTSNPPTTSSTTPPTTSSPPPGAQRYTAETAGGKVTSRCTPDGLVEVMFKTPALGFSVDSRDDGINDHPSVKFRSGDREIEVRLRCVNGVPSPEIKEDD